MRGATKGKACSAITASSEEEAWGARAAARSSRSRRGVPDGVVKDAGLVQVADACPYVVIYVCLEVIHGMYTVDIHQRYMVAIFNINNAIIIFIFNYNILMYVVYDTI